MLVLTPDRAWVATEEELTAAFQEHRDHGYRCFQLHRDDGAYLSAIGEGFGPYTLEWFPAEKTGTHLRVAEELKSQEVLAAMLDYLHGGSSWRKSSTWQEVGDEKPPWLARLLGRLFRAKGGRQGGGKMAGTDFEDCRA
jgi:hypothetical protein